MKGGDEAALTEKKMTRTLIAAARNTRNGFTYNEIEVVDAESMISDLASEGYIAWICGSVKVKKAQPTSGEKSSSRVDKARAKRDAAAAAYLIAVSDFAARLISLDEMAAAKRAREQAEKAYTQALSDHKAHSA